MVVSLAHSAAYATADTTLARFREGSHASESGQPITRYKRSQPLVTKCCSCVARRAAAHVLAQHRACQLQVPLPPLLGHCAAAGGHPQHGAGPPYCMVSHIILYLHALFHQACVQESLLRCLCCLAHRHAQTSVQTTHDSKQLLTVRSWATTCMSKSTSRQPSGSCHVLYAAGQVGPLWRVQVCRACAWLPDNGPCLYAECIFTPHASYRFSVHLSALGAWRQVQTCRARAWLHDAAEQVLAGARLVRCPPALYPLLRS